MKRILVIDDEKAVRNSFKLTFENTNYAIDVAENGVEGFKMFTSNEYDLIFLDLKMPEMSGVEVLTKIRKFNSLIPVYIITAFYKEFFNELNEARNAGYAFELVNKPLKREDLFKIVNCIIGE